MLNLFSFSFTKPRIFFLRLSKYSSSEKRNSKYAQINGDDLNFFSKILGAQGVITDEDKVKQHNSDWMGKYVGKGKLVLKPKSTEEVSSILSYCNQRMLAVVPQSGNTGLVGGSVPVFDEIVLSLSRMNQIINFDHRAGAVAVEAGVILENLETHVNRSGYCIPLDLGAKGSCFIGGNVSTNAGGLRLLRYGSLHGSVLGLEVVLANGEILNNMNALRKDNTGYDLKQLFIGSEGTLGIITKSVNVLLLAVKDYDQALSLLAKAKHELAEILSAFEFWDNDCMQILKEYHSTTKDGFNKFVSSETQFYVLIETSGSHVAHDQEKLTQFLESAMQLGLVDDGVMAENLTQQSQIWKLRETITLSLKIRGKGNYKYDISLPVEKMYEIVEIFKQKLKDSAFTAIVGYGHMGDGNLHLNIMAPEYSDYYLNQIEPFVYEYTQKHGGSISAEHGIGLMKRDKLHYSKTQPMINLMKSVKNLLDPNEILNPYKMLPLNE